MGRKRKMNLNTRPDLADRGLGTDYRRQTCRDQRWEFVEGRPTLEQYREIRNRLRVERDQEVELQLREAMDSVWFRLSWSDRRVVMREHEEYVAGLMVVPGIPA